MKKIITLSFLFISLIVNAQQNLKTDKIVAQLTQYYNNDQFSDIYKQLTPEFQKAQSEQTIISFFRNNLKQPLGKIISSKYQDTNQGVISYLITFDRGKLSLKIILTKEDQIGYMEWLAPQEKMVIANPKDPASIKTSNPKQTKLQLYVDSLALAYLKDSRNSSLSIGLVNGNNTETFFYGETKKGTGNLPNGTSLYEIASISKTFTGIMLAHAINEKKITLNDDIRKYLPGNYPDLQFKNEPVKIVNLSNHTSRLPSLPYNFEKQPGYDPANPYLHYSKEMIYQFLTTFKPDTISGLKVEYSNLGFAILGTILENSYKMPLENLLQQVITGPLKMKDTHYDLLENQKNLLTTGYNSSNGIEVPHWELGAFKAAGGLKSGLNDMLLYLKANMNAKNRDFSLSHQQTSQKDGLSRGLAWVIEPVKNYTIIWHNGGTAGFRSFCGFIKDGNSGVVVLSNSSADVDDLARKLLAFKN